METNKQVGISNWIPCHTSFKNVVKSIMTWPLLPSEQIVPTFEFITPTFGSLEVTEKIEKFKQYHSNNVKENRSCTIINFHMQSHNEQWR